LIPIVYNNFQTQWDASWEIDLFGRLRNEVSAQRADIDASQDDRNNVLLTLVSDVGRSYLMLRGDQQRLAISRQNIEIERDTLKLTKDLAQAGQSTDREVAQAEAQLDSIQATVPQIQTSIEESMFRLSVLTGQEPGALRNELVSEKPLPPAPPDVPAGLPLDLLKRRPDIQKAEAQLRAATYRIGEAQADYFPRMTLLGSAGRQALQLHELSLGVGNVFSIGPSVTLPIFDSGRIRSQVRLRQAQAQEAAANYKASILASFEDVEKALTELSAEQTRMNNLEAQVKANQTALELSRVQYNAGLADFLTVLTSERDLFSATDQLAASKTSLDLDIVSLYKSLGGGWQSP
jgi:NodT family efflux transporter outer membrane factor (OMF) lipoprotein